MTLLLMFVGFGLLSADGQKLNNPNKQGPLGTQVNTLSGNLFIPRTDIYIPSRSFDLDIKFNYNSFLFMEDYGYGKGWTFKYNIRYEEDTIPGRKLIIWGDGREDKYDSIPGGTYKTPPGFFNKLTQYQPGKFLLAELNGKKHFFDSPEHRRITRIEEPNGNYISFTYTDSLLTEMTNAAGQGINFTYNSEGRLTSVTDAITTPTRTFTYSYDATGNLKEVKDPLNGKLQYTYLVNGPMKSLADKNNNKVDIIYFPDMTIRELIGCNKRLSFSYDTTSHTTIVTDHLESGNQVTKYIYKTVGDLSWISSVSGNCCGFNLKYDYDDEGNLLKMTDANGQVFKYTYDSSGNVLTATDPLGGVIAYSYTTDFNKIHTIKDAKGNLYSLSYDNKGNMTELLLPGNNKYTATFSSSGDILTSTDPKGNVYVYNYDSYGNPTNVSGPNGYNAVLSFDARGRLLSYTDARGNTSTGEYDILNRLKKLTDPINDIVLFNYDPQGNLVSVKNKNNETTTLNYDASNRLVKRTGPTGNQLGFYYDGMDNLLGVKNALGFETRFTYDNLNRLKSSRDPENNNTLYSYDANGNITGINFPNGRVLNYFYDPLNRLVRAKDETSTLVNISYDKNGNITSITNATGAITTATYDSLNRVKTLTDPLGNSKQIAYDKNNNITAVTDREGRTSFFAYDSLNRIKSYTDNNGNTMMVGYDAESNITILTDQNNNTTTYTYDSLNRRKRMIFPDGKYKELTYDKKDNVTSMRLTDGTSIIYQYDSLNRLVSRILPGGEIYSFTYDKLNRVLTATNTNGTVTFTYDVLNRVKSETFDGRTVRYNYDISGRKQTTIYPDSTVVVKEFDTRDRLLRISKNNVIIVEYAYNDADQLTNKIFANGVSTSMQYDFSNRLSSISTNNGTIQNSLFSYDKENNKTLITRPNNNSTEQFAYDNGYRLTSYTKGPGGAVISNNYSYDAVGNRISAILNGVNVTYGTNNLNQLTGVNSTNFTFDARGNLTYDGHYHKTYDAENRLIRDSASPINVLVYGYDAMNRRVTKMINGNILKYTYSGAAQIEERDQDGNLLNRTMLSNFLSPVLNERNEQPFYFHSNELGSVEAITNNEGRTVENYSYDAFGKLSRYDSSGNLLPSSITGNRFGFTGQEYDSATSTYRFFFRNYSPETGVFNQRDLIEYEDGMGMYQYVKNNPANGIDVWGLSGQHESFFPPPPPKPTADNCNNKPLIDLRDVYKIPGPIDEILREIGEYNHSTSESERNENKQDIIQEGVGVGIKATIANLGSLAYNQKFVFQNVVAGVTTGGAQAAAGHATLLSGGLVAGAGAVPLAAAGFYGVEVYEDSWDYEAARIERDAYIYMLNHGREGEGYERYIKLKQLEELLRLRDEKYMSSDCDQGGTNKKFRIRWDEERQMFVLEAFDPNLIVGPEGKLDKKWVSVNDRLPYTILFENDSSATARARYVKITSPVEPKQDPATLELGSVGFNKQTFEIPQGLSSYYQRLDARDSTGVYVDLTAGYDVINNQIFWEFQAIDPLTLLPPEDPLAGFLFLHDSANVEYGNGFVNFSIKPRTNAQTLDTIGAKASIVFDENDIIPTNIHTNTIDAHPPVSIMNTSVQTISPGSVRISWNGNDDPGGSGLASYSLYVSLNNSPYSLFRSNIPDTSLIIDVTGGSNYCFFVTAKDTVNNQEALKNSCELNFTPVAVTPSVTITANPGNLICSGTTVTFTAIPVNGGTPVYQWKLNGVNVGTDSDTYQNNGLADGDIISVEMTSSLGGASPNPVISNMITMIVNPSVIPSVTIVANPGTSICAGTPVSFTATPVNGGTAIYQWKLNGNNVGTNSNVYQNGALVNGDIISVEMISSLECAGPNPVTSGMITIAVSEVVTPSVSISASPGNSICSGTNVIFTATPTNGGAPSYQWKLNGVNVGTNSDTYQNAFLVNGDIISLVMTSSLGCASPEIVNSNSITMILTPAVTPSVSITASPGNNISSGTNVTFTATPTHGGTPIYQWKLNGVNVGNNTDTYQNASLLNGDVVSVVMTSSLQCANPASSTSNSISMTVTGQQPVTINIGDATVLETAGSVQVPVTLSAPSSSTITVRYKTENGTARQPDDYTRVNNATLTFAPGELSKTVSIPIINDAIIEGEENFFVSLNNPLNATIAGGEATVIITEPLFPAINIGDAIVLETAGVVLVPVNLSGPSSSTITVRYKTDNGTAKQPHDYTRVNNVTLTFNPGEISKTASIPIINDAIIEGDEIFFVSLNNPLNATIADGEAIITITEPFFPSISIGDVLVQENAGYVQVPVTLSGPSSASVTVKYKTENGTAKQPHDYTRMHNLTLTFAPGEISKSISIPIINDIVIEGDEFFQVTLSNPVNAVIANEECSVTITESLITRMSNNKISGDEMNNNELSIRVPNPQRKQEIFKIIVNQPGKVGVELTDISGRTVFRVANYQNNWSMQQLATGIYFYRINFKSLKGKTFYYNGKLFVTN